MYKLVGILLLNTFVYKYMDAQKRTFSIATKFILGMTIACISMLLAGLIEIVRQNYCISDISQCKLINILFIPILIYFSK